MKLETRQPSLQAQTKVQRMTRFCQWYILLIDRTSSPKRTKSREIKLSAHPSDTSDHVAWVIVIALSTLSKASVGSSLHHQHRAPSHYLQHGVGMLKVAAMVHNWPVTHGYQSAAHKSWLSLHDIGLICCVNIVQMNTPKVAHSSLLPGSGLTRGTTCFASCCPVPVQTVASATL